MVLLKVLLKIQRKKSINTGMIIQLPVVVKDSLKGKGHSLFNLATKVGKQTHAALKVDTSPLAIRHFNPGVLQRLSKSDDFDYVDEKAYTGSLWDNFWRWFWQTLEHLFGRRPTGNPYSKYFYAAVILIIIAAVIIRFVRKSSGGLISRPSKQIFEDLNISENIHEISFPEEISKALTNNNYRLAVRLHYLLTLKQLNDAGLINWRAEKTNTAYINEIKDPTQRSLFGTITRQFEYVWYGNFTVDDHSYQSINSLFNNFNQTL